MLCSNGAMPCEARDLKKMAPGGTRSESLQLAPGPGGWTNWTNRQIPCCLRFGELSLWTFRQKKHKKYLDFRREKEN